MTPVSEFDALVQSFGETAVGYIGKDYLRSLSVVASPETRDASVVIVPREHSPEFYDQIIDKMVEVRGMYLGELHVDYMISDRDDKQAVGSSTNTVFAAA